MPFGEQALQTVIRPANKHARTREATTTPLRETRAQSHSQGTERLAITEQTRTPQEYVAPPLATLTESELISPTVQNELIEAPEQPVLLTSETVLLPDSSAIDPAREIS